MERPVQLRIVPSDSLQKHRLTVQTRQKNELQGQHQIYKFSRFFDP
jgi:hypothetical protein